MTRRPLFGLLALTALGVGCAPLDVTLHGNVQAPLVEPPASTEEHPLVLAFDRLGNLTLNGRVLELSTAREGRQFGVGVVDAGGLPAPWRPEHASAGGVMVSSLRKASPLAVVGLRPFDVVLQLDGEPVTSVEGFVARLRRIEEEAQVELEVTKPDGRSLLLVATARGLVGDSSRIDVPGLFERRDSTTGHALGIGPFEALFFYRTRVEHDYLLSESLGHSDYHERFEWGVLGNMFGYATRLNPRTGERVSRIKLFWIPLGDDL